MKRHYLLAGSFAYDTVFQHAKAFSVSIKPGSIDKLNTSFQLDSVVEAFGGCAANIGYNAALLGDSPLLVGNVGEEDGDRYLRRIEGWGLDTSDIGMVADQTTAHAWVLTDAKGNQMTSFYPGAMTSSVDVPAVAPALWHIAPEDPVNMVKLALEARARGVEYFFDPGQALPALIQGTAKHVASLEEVFAGAKGIFLNEYECSLVAGNYPVNILSSPDQFLVRTRGSCGADLVTQGDWIRVRPARPDAVVDPTGCGDAFRAGFLHGYVREKSLVECMSLGSVMGAVAVGSAGGQNHDVVREELYERWTTHLKTATY
jgi:adenosine kinase